VRALARKMHNYGYEPGEVIEQDEKVCFVMRGTAVRNGRPYVRGTYWGEDIIVSSKVLRDRRRSSALTYCQVVCLSGQDLREVLKIFPVDARALRIAALIMCLARAPQLIARYIDMKEPHPKMFAQKRRKVQPTSSNKSFMGRGDDDASVSSPNKGALVKSPGNAAADDDELSSEEEEAPMPEPVHVVKERFRREQSKTLGKAMKSLGAGNPVNHREFHEVMKLVNGGVPLRGLAREQRKSRDSTVRELSRKALVVAPDEGRLLVDEQLQVVDADGDPVFVPGISDGVAAGEKKDGGMAPATPSPQKRQQSSASIRRSGAGAASGGLGGLAATAAANAGDQTTAIKIMVEHLHSEVVSHVTAEMNKVFQEVSLMRTEMNRRASAERRRASATTTASASPPPLPSSHLGPHEA